MENVFGCWNKRLTVNCSLRIVPVKLEWFILRLNTPQRLDSLFGGKEDLSAAIVLQAQKRGRDESPNPLISLAPRGGLEPPT